MKTGRIRQSFYSKLEEIAASAPLWLRVTMVQKPYAMIFS
ncbi:hypothetical protein PROFUN_11536 [Planoprotostelium fungivorum]|uniref:Uncharacterized protein n=1 Tax=Planoprotostelium fungivorum TaxID=1890364 RepID=A0A2P6NA10_9EUKA|nr:hypothetical protein PROFUN_11536 [Planoprotostelium fungivorum]